MPGRGILKPPQRKIVFVTEPCLRELHPYVYPRLQLRTVKELMEDKGIERPSIVAATDETFKKAPESKKKHGEQKALEL
jgi:hypothetical protein